MKTFFTIIILCFLSINLFSQVVVISEYNNVTGDPLGEWTELLVIEDNTNLVGFTLRDNAGSTPPPSQWTGGIRFKNHPLWRNLRAGTIIVINHRYSPYQSVDVDKRDGYIEIDAENETYFEKRCFSCIVGPEWYQKALNIAQESDILQIIDQNDNHIHALAHLPAAEGDWVNLPQPKVAYVGSIPRGGVTVRVCPGRTLSAYNKGFDTRREETDQSSDFVTKGKPNNRAGFVNQNQLFWRSLREPKWNSPTASAKVFRDSVILTWNPINDPYPQDSVNGYLIVRISYELLGSAQQPVDSRIYNVGDNLGSGVVVGLVNYSQATRFVDRFSLQCGVRYVYRIYAFRYRRDDFREDTDEYSARGVAYNESSFAQVEVEKNIPPKPVLFIAKGSNKVCEGDTVVLKVKESNRVGQVVFRWYANGNSIGEGFDSLIVLSSGEYKVEIQDTLGCSATSEPVTINVVNYPKLILYANGKEITKDTTLVLCPSEKVDFKLLGWFKYKLYKDNQLVEEASKSEWSVSLSGVYYFGADNEICFAKTPNVTVRYLDLRLQIVPSFVKLFVDKNQIYRDTIIILRNLGKDTIRVDNITFSLTSFELISPNLPINIPPNSEVQLLVRFKPLKSGVYLSQMILQKNCKLYDTVSFEGTKAKTVLIYNLDTLNFGVVPICDNVAINNDFSLVNDSDEEVQLLRVEISSPFEILEPMLPLNLVGNDNIRFKVKLRNTGSGFYSGTLKIVYKYSGIVDSLQIPVKGVIANVEYSINKNFQDNVILGECENSTTLTISIVNKSFLGLNVKIVPESDIIKIYNANLSLNANDTILISFDLKPNNIGLGKTKIFFTIEPCNIMDSLEINYFKKGFLVTFNQDTIDFGKIYTCDNDNQFSKTLTVQVVGDSLGMTKIKEVKTTEPIKVLIAKDSSLNDGSTLEFLFEPTRNGLYEGMVTFILAPCNNEYKVWFKGEYVRSQLIFSTDTIDFGDVEIGKSSSKKLVVSNIGDTLVVVEKSQITDSLNFDIQPQIFTRQTMKNNDSISFEIVFHPNAGGYFVSDAFIKIGFPCDSVVRIVLKGRGKTPLPKKLTLFIKEYRFKPSTVAIVPIQFSMEGTSLKTIDSIAFDLSYNHRIFNISTVYSGSFTVQSQIDYMNNLIHCSLNTKNQDISEGIFAYLQGMVLIGEQKYVDLKISNVKVFGEQSLDVVLENGKIIIDSVCMVDFRLISPETLPEFTAFIRENNLEVKVFSEVENVDAKIYVYDLLGRCLFSKTIFNIPKGESEYQFPLVISPSQKLFVLVRYGDSIKSCLVNYK
jgi:hypothetical protein